MKKLPKSDWGMRPCCPDLTPEMIEAAEAAYAEIAGWGPTPQEHAAALKEAIRAALREWSISAPQEL